MSYVQIATGDTVTAEQFSSDCFDTYTKMLFWKYLMGTDDSDVIQVDESLSKKPGDAITFNIAGEMVGGLVTGANVGIGNEGAMSFYGQRVEVDNVRRVIRMDDVPMTEQRAAFGALMKMKRALTVKMAETLDDDITTAMSDVTTGRVRGRYLYGAADSNWNATHATALSSGIDATNDQLTTNMLRIAKRKAKLIPVALAKIRPMKVMNGKNSEEWFMAVCHPYAIRDLFDNDAAWKNAQLNIPPRGNSDSVIFSGNAFKGAYDGILIYEYEGINLVSSTIQCAHNLFLGAQACFVAWGQRSKYGEEFNDINHRLSSELHEIRGVEKAVFDRATAEDAGIVHVFSAAVAD